MIWGYGSKLYSSVIHSVVKFAMSDKWSEDTVPNFIIVVYKLKHLPICQCLQKTGKTKESDIQI